MRFLTISALIGISVLAISAAVAGEALAAPNIPPAFAWAGFHVGGNFGGVFPLHREESLHAASGFTSSAFDLQPNSLDHSGFSFGAHVGYDWQFGPWVYGIETELNFHDTRHGPNGLYLAPPSYWPSGVEAYGISSEPSGNYFSGFRGRLGIAAGSTLLYVTGGVVAGGWRGASSLTF
jgi:high affinity Mn2+ porin